MEIIKVFIPIVSRIEYGDSPLAFACCWGKDLLKSYRPKNQYKGL